ncbi:acetamidase/formamidase family protein [Mesorhizobium marinum]|uniref:acetamidase/formamidase family protein n=1 Tax=Mesorhizobium marinum TaxID=3228790 RepID=UPI003467A290
MTVAQIDLDAIPSDGRPDMWRRQLREIGLVPLPDAGYLDTGTLASFTAPAGTHLAIVSGRSQSFGFGPTGLSSDPLTLLLVLVGRGRLSGPRKALELADSDLVVLAPGTDIRVEMRGDFSLLILDLSREAIDARLGRNRMGLPVALGTTVAASAARPVLRTLAMSLHSLDAGDFAAAEIAVTELVASALLAETRGGGERTDSQMANFRRIAAAIDRRLGEPGLSIQDVAEHEGLSRRYVQRLFEQHGKSFSDYVRRLRLERCKAELADPAHAHENVGTIAMRWGYRDQAHFSRAFSSAYGQAPSNVRRVAGATDNRPLQRGKPLKRPSSPTAFPNPRGERRTYVNEAKFEPRETVERAELRLPVKAQSVHWGYLSKNLPPVLTVFSGATVTVETLTQHAGDDHERMILGDQGAESVFAWTKDRKAVDRRGAGPMNASIFGRGAGEGFGVHILTGPIFVREAEPGDAIEVEFLDIRPRPCANPAFSGKAYASNASAWWGYQYRDPIVPGERHETVTIFEIDLAEPHVARPIYSYRWTPQTDPFGVVHETMDYPGIVVDPTSVKRDWEALRGVEVPARPHFGTVALAPREDDVVDSIPPGYFGGNIDNWRLAKGSRIFLPVSVPGGLLSLGDGHFAQGDGEANGTGLECSLTTDIRVTLHKASEGGPSFLRALSGPLIETESHWVIQSFSYPNYLRELGRDAQSKIYQRSSIDLAMRHAFRQARRFLMEHFGLSEDEAHCLLSVGADFGVTQVADGNFGVHATIPKALCPTNARCG